MSLGKHAIANLYNCNIKDMDDLEKIKKIIIDSANEKKLHILKDIFYKFNPIGITGVLILSESHLTVHTWPEYKFIAVDVFTCGENFKPKEVCDLIAKKVKSQNYDIREFERGKNGL